MRCVLVSAALSFAPMPSHAQSVATISITEPGAGATIHDNDGNVPIVITLRASGSIVVLLDGKPYGPRQNGTSFVLQDVDRGEHKLQVQLVDADGTVVASSATVTFYLWRASALFPARMK
ncbi:MAG: hypothetical protein ACXWCY_21470 [Burkholderiales bacterium]